MRIMAVLAIVTFAALYAAMMNAGPVYAAQTTATLTNAGAAVDQVVNTNGTLPVQLVRGGHGRGHGFRGAHFRHYPRFYGGFYGPYYSTYSGYGSGYYDTGDKVCVWNGYNYRCYKVIPEEY
jgi:hypothetical protein